MATLFKTSACTVLRQVPLVVFKREKEISRSLEFDGMWIAEQPGDDDIRGHWDKLVISTGSFPDKYWDPFVKKKVGGLARTKLPSLHWRNYYQAR